MTQRYHPSDFKKPRHAWPVGLIASLLLLATLTHIAALHAGVEFGIALEQERARIAAARQPKAALPVEGFDCSKRGWQRVRELCSPRAKPVNSPK